MAQHEGVVRWFNNAKGYGFLGRDDDAEAFVHSTSIQREGYKLTKKGPRATSNAVPGDTGTRANQVVLLKRKI